MPILYIIAGPNGAGKTTASKTLLPEFFGINQFVKSVSVEAGRIMLARIKTLIKGGQSFGFETTLTTLARNF